MIIYCRGCNREVEVEGEEYQEYWKEKGTGKLHPKVDCDEVEDVQGSDTTFSSAGTTINDKNDLWADKVVGDIKRRKKGR